MSRIVFGGWAAGGWHWGGADDRATAAAVNAAIEHGMNTFDTAPVYGFGRSESVIGAALGDHRREDVVIMTKCGLRWDDTAGLKFFDAAEGPDGRPVEVFRNLRRSSILRECDASLQRLGIETIDIYQIHWPDASVPLDEAARAFEDLYRAGKIRYAGVSNFSVEMMMEWKRKSSVPIVSDQERFSLLARKLETSGLQYTRKHKITMFAYGPLAQGLLTGRVPVSRSFPDGDERSAKSAFSADRRASVLTALENVRSFADRKEISFGQLALAWVLATPGMGGALAGIRNAGQAAENARAGDVEMTAEEWRTIGDAFRDVPPP